MNNVSCFTLGVRDQLLHTLVVQLLHTYAHITHIGSTAYLRINADDHMSTIHR